jgi:hypothetical protein
MKRIRAVTVHRFLDKRIENRTWNCYLNPGEYLAIHNGVKWDSDGEVFVRSLNPSELISNPTKDNDPPMAIIAIAHFLGNVTSSTSPWFKGPIGWKLENVVAIDPVYCPGQQGLWEIPKDVLVKIRCSYQIRTGGNNA